MNKTPFWREFRTSCSWHNHWLPKVGIFEAIFDSNDQFNSGDRYMKKYNCFFIQFSLLLSHMSYGQSSLSISAPMIWSNVTIRDNWTPPSSPNYQEYLNGNGLGYGVGLIFSFQPKIVTKNKHIWVSVGLGYFEQKFKNTGRPFDYDTPLLPVVRTNDYSYQCWYGAMGLAYNYNLSEEYIFTAGATFNLLQSYRQVYVPNASNSDMFPPQVNDNRIDYGRIFYCSVGLSRRLGERLMVELSLVVPVFTRWRNDRIFADDPATFSKTDFSLGTELRLTYLLKKQKQ